MLVQSWPPGAQPAAGPDRAEVHATPIPSPSVLEQALVVLTTFVFIHEIPNGWFIDRSALSGSYSNPLLVLTELALTGLAFARVAGYLNLLIQTYRLRPGIYLFSFLAACSVFWSSNPGETLKGAIVFVAVTLYASYLVIRFSLEEILRLLGLMFVLSAVVNIAFTVAFPALAFDVDGNMTGVLVQKNILGYVAVLALPVLLLASREWPTGRLLFYPAILAHIGLLIASQSKTMLLACGASTLAVYFYQGFRSERTLPGAVFVGLAGSGVATVAFATANIRLLADWLDKDITLTGRLPLWRDLLVVARERPLLGHGYRATFDGWFSPVHEVWIANPWNPSHAHNALLQIWLEVGLVGVVIFLIVYVRTIVGAVTVAMHETGAVAIWPLIFMTTTLSISITESGMTSEAMGWTMFVVASLSVAGQLDYRRRTTVPAPPSHLGPEPGHVTVDDDPPENLRLILPPRR